MAIVERSAPPISCWVSRRFISGDVTEGLRALRNSAGDRAAAGRARGSGDGRRHADRPLFAGGRGRPGSPRRAHASGTRYIHSCWGGIGSKTSWMATSSPRCTSRAAGTRRWRGFLTRRCRRGWGSSKGCWLWYAWHAVTSRPLRSCRPRRLPWPSVTNLSSWRCTARSRRRLLLQTGRADESVQVALSIAERVHAALDRECKSRPPPGRAGRSSDRRCARVSRTARLVAQRTDQR